MLELSLTFLDLHFSSGAKLPRWLGSAFRGGLGQHLKRISCYHPMRECKSCDRAQVCLFYATYEKPVAKQGHAPPPRPIILVPPFFGKEMEFAHEAKLELKLLMFGEYVHHFPYVILALQQFGSCGLGDVRHLGQNKFEVVEARCRFSGKPVYDGDRIYPENMEIMDVVDFPLIDQKHLRIGFRTPIELPLGFPPSPEHLLTLIRRRLVLFVNEYGNGEKVPEFKVSGKVETVAKHYHRLVGCSQRSGKREFWNCWTGIADYEFEELDETGRWLLGVGRELGAGAKSSFGLGFFDIWNPERKEEERPGRYISDPGADFETTKGP
ncbi:MAG: hypothetical protein QXI28_04820 [Candidatus Hadarchaeales archaeon]